jgi:hypothetical protein
MMEQIKGAMTMDIRSLLEFKELVNSKIREGCDLVLFTLGYHSSKLNFSDILELGF